MTAVALRCAAALRRTSLIFGILLVLLVAIPFSIDPLRFPWRMVTSDMPTHLLALPGVGLAMALLGIAPAPMLLTRTIAALLAGVAVLTLFGITPGIAVGLKGALPVALATTSLILIGAAARVRRVAPWSSVGRPIAAIGVLCALGLYLIPGVAGEGLLVVNAVRALRGASGVGLFLAAAALLPLALAVVSVTLVLPPRALGPGMGRVLGTAAEALPAAVAAIYVVQSGAASAGLATIIAIVLLAGFVWPSTGVAVLAYGLFGSDEPDAEEVAAVDDFDPSQYFGERTQQMDAWTPEAPEDEGEATRIVQSPMPLIERSTRGAADRTPSPPARRQPAPPSSHRTEPRRPEPSRQAPTRPAPSGPAPSRPATAWPEPEEPDDSDRTMMLDRPLGKRRK